MTNGFAIPPEPAGQAQFIERLDAAGLAGIAIGQGLHAPPLTRELLDAAEARAFPVLVVVAARQACGTAAAAQDLPASGDVSGFGRELGVEGITAFTETKHGHLDFAASPSREWWFPYERPQATGTLADAVRGEAPR